MKIFLTPVFLSFLSFPRFIPSAPPSFLQPRTPCRSVVSKRCPHLNKQGLSYDTWLELINPHLSSPALGNIFPLHQSKHSFRVPKVGFKSLPFVECRRPLTKIGSHTWRSSLARHFVMPTSTLPTVLTRCSEASGSRKASPMLTSILWLRYSVSLATLSTYNSTAGR